MRYLYVFALALPAAFSQGSSNTSTRIPDINGGTSIEGPSISSNRTAAGSSRTEYSTSINGQLAPRESVEEKIIRQDANGKVIERYVRKFDATGNPGRVEKTVIEERKSGNTVSTTATVYRADLNGNLSPAERSVSQSVTQGATTTTETAIERSGFDGASGLTAAERVTAVVVQTGKDAQQVTTTRMRKDPSGNFYVAVREVSDKQTENGAVVENRVQYVDGALAEQSVSRTIVGKDGSSTTTVDVFSTQAPGLSADAAGVGGGKLALKEQQQITSQPGAGGKVTQTVVSRKPNVSDANRLGPAQVLSQTVCTGACNP